MSYQWSNGGLVDESVPDLRPILTDYGVGIEADALAAWLAPRLGHYRAACDRSPPRNEQLEMLAGLRTAMLDVAGRIDDLPGESEAEITYAAWKIRRAQWSDIARQLRTQLLEAVDFIEEGCDGMRDAQGQTGRRENVWRDRLLTALVAKLSAVEAMKRSSTCALAGDILRRCGIPCPSDPKEVARIVRSIEKGEKSSAAQG